MQNIKTLYDQPIVIEDRVPPLTIKVICPVNESCVGGAVSSNHKTVTYVNFEVLNDELKRKVIMCIESL